jgi:glycosyltransferase involved in cell wall biosynthesis
MKILFLNTFDMKGGAAIATYRIFNALYKDNFDVYEYVLFKSGHNPNIKGPATKYGEFVNIHRLYFDHLPNIFYKNRFANLSVSWVSNNNLIKKIKHINPDIVHLNWINDGLLSIENLKKIKKPLIWTLHDMWAFTGGCHYGYDSCERYINNCGRCPQIKSKHDFDLSRCIFNRKKRVYNKLNLTVVSPSNWLAECAKKSSLFKDNLIKIIPYLVDLEKYRMVDKHICRSILGLPEEKKLILYGAMNALKDKRKGFSHLKDGLDKLKKRLDFELVIFGAERNKNLEDYGYKTYFLGSLFDDYSLMMTYNAADLIVVPSEQDNLPNVIIEAFACGTPCVAFKIGGIPDIIDHKINGYLVEPFDTNDLSNGIEWILNQNEEMLRKNARVKVENYFSSSVVLKKYIDLYKEII